MDFNELPAHVWPRNSRREEDGVVTVVEAGPCVVTQIRTAETDGYNAIQIAFGEIDPRKAQPRRR